MALFSVEHVCIRGISAAVPANTESNADLPGYEEKELGKLIKTLGIEQRRVAGKQQRASDLCIAAAEKLISELGWDKSEITALFFISQTPDYSVPGSSFHIAERLGLPKSCVCTDVNQGCAGYVYGLSLMSAFMSSTKLNKGLLLVGDTITKLVSENDKALIPIFSDAGTATALVYSKSAPALKFNLSTEGVSFDAIMVKEGYLSMKGLDVFNFSLKKVAPNVEELLSYFNYSADEADYFVFHQANALILEAIGKKLNLPSEKVLSSLQYYGNTSGASVPLTIVNNLGKNKTKISADMMLCGFGVGLSLASALVSFKDVLCTELIELA